MTDTPKLVGIVLCERVLQDVLRLEAVSCINIYNGITAQSFPAVVPLVFAFSQVIGNGQTFEYQFRINDDTGTAIAISPPQVVKPLPNQNITHKIISAFSQLTFERPGVYEIELLVGGESLGALPFQVVPLSMPKEAVEQAPPA